MKRLAAGVLMLALCAGMLSGCNRETSSQAGALSTKLPPNNVQQISLENLFLTAVFSYRNDQGTYTFNPRMVSDFNRRIENQRNAFLQVASVTEDGVDIKVSDWYYLYYDSETKQISGYLYSEKDRKFSYQEHEVLTVESIGLDGKEEGDSLVLVTKDQSGQAQTKELFQWVNPIDPQTPKECAEMYLRGEAEGFGPLQFAVLSTSMRREWLASHSSFFIKSRTGMTFTAAESELGLIVPEENQGNAYFLVYVTIRQNGKAEEYEYQVSYTGSQAAAEESAQEDGGTYRITKILSKNQATTGTTAAGA